MTHDVHKSHLSGLILGIICMALSLYGHAHAAEARRLIVICSESNPAWPVFRGEAVARFDRLEQALAEPDAAAAMILADGYPEQRTTAAPEQLEAARHKNLRVYVEYPVTIPGIEFGPARIADWQRAVVASDALNGTAPASGPARSQHAGLERMRILQINECHYLPLDDGGLPAGAETLLVLGRVAGFDTAVFGLPKDAAPILFEMPERRLIVATTCLSRFVTARYAPAEDWKMLWRSLLRRLMADEAGTVPALPELSYTPPVRPRHGRDEPLPADAERQAIAAFASWLVNSRLLISAPDEAAVHELLRKNAEERALPSANAPVGDGSCGILEGFSSGIRYDGSQRQRTPIRADCNAESAMCLALASALGKDKRVCATAASAVDIDKKHCSQSSDTRLPTGANHRQMAENLLNYIYFNSELHGGVRGDPKHPAFGLIAWGAISPAWTRANYGDDDARVILSTILAASWLKSDRWDERLMRALLANLRTTGRKGFRGERIDIPPLEQLGWRHYHDADTVFISPHYESGLWACYLWAYARTQHREFLDKAKSAISMTMRAYPDGWHWRTNLERARMLPCLAWLVRVEDTPEHRQWLARVIDDLLKYQDRCGAIAEILGVMGSGHFLAPTTNEEYGTRETPLLQRNGDPVSDQLYTTGFALFGLNEAFAATHGPRFGAAADKLAAFLCRIQIRSETLPYLDGGWFRAFDYGRWDYWASSADVGWGAWCLEAGWAQAWTAAAMGLRQMHTSMWDLTADSRIARHLETVQKLMAQNDGSPWQPAPTSRPE